MLYDEVVEYGERVREKWRETVRSCVHSRRLEEGEGEQRDRVRGGMFGERRQYIRGNGDGWE